VEKKLILSWILEEIRQTRKDEVTIVCKDNLRMQGSALLLAAVAPNFAQIFSTIDIESCLIMIPDVEISSVLHMFEKTFSMQIITDLNVLQDLETIFWKPKSSLKEEKDSAIVSVEDDFIDDEVKCEIADDSIANAEYKKESFIDDLDSGIQRRKGRKRKLKTLEQISTKRKRKKRTKSEDSAGEEDLDYDDDSFENGVVKIPSGRSSGKSSYVPVTLDDQPKDEKWIDAQERLKEALLDENVHTDPQKLWFQYHGHHFDVKFSELNPKLICPICQLKFSIYKKGLVYFLHLQRHKYQNFKCACMPPGKFKIIRKHILESHWKWPKCDICKDVIDPDKMANHLRHKHGQVNKTLICSDCGTSFPAGKNREFRMHMEYHRAENFSCNCSIVFKSKLQKVHHIQVEHVKEMFGCSKCYFVCIQESTLKEHMKKKHQRSKESKLKKPIEIDSDLPKRLICDICGYECKSNKVGYLERHKARMHDPVLLDCPHCPAKFNASGLKQHIFNTHDSNGICNICGAVVKNIKRHMKNMHQPKHLLKYKCQYCDRAFQWAQDIKKHVMNVHLKERPYKCRYGCEVAYNDSSNRNQHEKRKHGCIYSGQNLKVEFRNPTHHLKAE